MESISVVIPTFNRAGVVKRALESALRQSLRPAQIIVIDDGSTDDTREVLGRYGDTIEYVRQENAGASVARNRGIALARHPWIAFLDSDDYWLPDHLARTAGAIDATGGQARFYFNDMQLAPTGDATLWLTLGFRPRTPFHLVPDATAWMLLTRRQPAMLQCSVFKATSFQQQGGFDPAIGQYRAAVEDAELFCRLGIGGPVCAVAGVGCVQTSDVTDGKRLTDAPSRREVNYRICNVMLWRRVLARFPHLDPVYRRLVRSNLADAYLRLGKSLLASRKIPRGVWSLLQVAATDPRFFLWLVRNGSSRGWSSGVRPPCPELEDVTS
jgi:glycosyltransferase involved in cell wall biosynthesis